MKKFLSLVLALVMTMSLVTISAGAKDFADDDAITYEEAVAVLSEIGVVDGYTDGTFKPATALNRGQAAKILCNLILGPTTAADLRADTAPFKDVAIDHQFAGYIAFCVEEGIISGYADGTFKPTAPLTSYAFMKMLLGALGYDAETEGYVGANWSINVAKRALAIGLTDDLKGDFNGVDTVVREEAALYAFNTLKATMVEYDAKTTIVVGDAQIGLSGNIDDVQWGTATKYDGNIDATKNGDGFVQFGEKYFPDLEREVVAGTYGRPANKWTNDNDAIGTFTSIEPAYIFTEGTAQEDVYDIMGKNKLESQNKDVTWVCYEDGAQADFDEYEKNEEADWDATADGAVTEVYVQGDIITIVKINYYLGEINRVKSDKDGDYVTVTALSNIRVNDNKFYTEGFEEEDLVVFTVDKDGSKKVIASVEAPETVTGEVSRVQKEHDSDETYVRIDGEKYRYSGWNVYDVDDTDKNAHPALKEEYNLYLDPNGFILGFEPAGEEADPEYLYVIDSWKEYGEWSAKVLLPDASVVRVDVEDEYETLFYTNEDGDYLKKIDWTDTDDGDSDGTSEIDGKIWAYTVDDDGVYTLEEVLHEDANENDSNWDDDVWNSSATAEIENDEAYVIFGEANTDYFIVDEDTLFVDEEGETTYTGYSAVPNIETAKIYYVLDGAVATIVFIRDGEIYDADSKYVMIDGSETHESTKHDGKYYHIFFDAYVNGELADEFIIRDNIDLEVGELYKVEKTVDGEYVTKVSEVDPKYVGYVDTVANKSFYLNGSIAAEDKWTINAETEFVVVEAVYEETEGENDTTVYTYDNELDISTGSLTNMKLTKAEKDEGWKVYVEIIESDDQKAELVYIYRFIDSAHTEDDNTPGADVNA